MIDIRFLRLVYRAAATHFRFAFVFVMVLSSLTAGSTITAQRAQPTALGALLVEPGVADSGGVSSLARRDEGLSLIVQLAGRTVLSSLGAAKLARPDGWRAHLESKNGRRERQRVASEHDRFERALLTAVPDARVTRKLRLALNAVAINVPPHAAATVAALPGVQAVWADTTRQLQTTRGPALVGATAAWTASGGNATTGDGVVVGVIDSGIWPEHPSFADPGPDGSYTAAPGWKGRACEFGGIAPGDSAFTCTNKLLGARRMMTTYDQKHTLQPGEFLSARDDVGHGTFMATVAAGNRNVPGQIRGNPIGISAGIAPHARLAVYKVCGRAGCYDSDAIAAIEQAIADGVDVLSLAFAGGADPFNDPLSLALLGAHEAGVFVAAPAGNSGAGSLLGRREPWTTVVGATRLDRAFVSVLTLRAGSITTTLYGTSVTTGIAAQTPIVNAATVGDPNCATSTPANSFTGSIVICARSGNSRVEKSRNVQLRGGTGMILINPTAADSSSDNHFVPTVHLDKAAADTLLAFLTTYGTAARATFTGGTAFTIAGEAVAAFTTRGGGGQPLSLSKPDLMAPGMFVAGGHTAAPPLQGGPAGESYQVIDGTSVAAAHVVGAGALLKALHPAWSPDHIRSALMLTAATAVTTENGQTATQFDIGAGRINVAAALSPGFAILPGAGQFLAKRDTLWDVNYPSLYVARLPGVLTTQRTLTNLENRQVVWSIQVDATSPLKISTVANVTLPPLGTATVPIVLDGSSLKIDYFAPASLTFTEVGGTRRLRLPIVVLRKTDALPILASCTPATIRVSQVTDCSITVSNSNPQATAVAIYDTLPPALQLVPGSVVNGSSSGSTVYHQPTLAAASPGTISVRVFPPWDGFLSLSTLHPPIVCSGSCDDRVFTASLPLGILFNGQVHSTITISTNGFVALGSGGSAAPINQSLPTATPPYGIFAPFWTDLHPAGTDGQGAGRLHAGYLSFPEWANRIYLAIEWNDVIVKGSTARHTFQIWFQVGGLVEDVTFAYDKLESLGAGGGLTVGAENSTGTAGTNHFYNGAGSAPLPQTNLFVSSPGPSPGGTHTMSFRARGQTTGTVTHCAVVTRSGSTEYGTSCVPIVVVP
jgi:uncharacterized repeat protein (TIGR01451 family)